LAQYPNTPTLRAAGFDDENENEAPGELRRLADSGQFPDRNLRNLCNLRIYSFNAD